MAFVPVIPESYSHVLAEFESLDPLLSALRLDSSRLKCTSIAVSRKWLALGSSGGGLHLIQKEGWKHRLFLSHREGAISQVACCLHDDDYVAVATSQGLVVVWELNQERRGKPEQMYVSSEHKGRRVTALCWDTAILRVFVGDHAGKVSAIKLNTSKQAKAAAAFVMFPVQTITTVDSCVVQLDYLDGRLLISSLTRSFLCDTEREKFWKIGNKERDGEYGACFFPGRCSGGQQPLIYCARPGSRMWEVNFDGEVISTHQFKKLLSLPPLPVITLRSEPQYDHTAGSSQSLSFPKLLHLSEHCVLTWTERGIYIFIPQNVQVLLWSEVKDIQDVAVCRNELFCLHLNGKVSHLSLISVERCVERLLRRGLWNLAARTCCLFQNSVIASRARKTLTADKLEHLKSQLDHGTYNDLISQLEELILKFEPLDSACSSRRSSISSHESFSILDSGIYRIISSRRGSQSDEDSCSLHSQTLSEDERFKEFTSQQEEDLPDQCCGSHGNEDNVSHAPVMFETDKNETFLPFGIPLPFRSPSPLVSLQAVKESVSSFVRKTTEKIGTLHTSPDLKVRPELRGDEQSCEEDVSSDTCPKEEDTEEEKEVTSPPPEEDRFQELKVATAEAMSSFLESLLQPESLRLDWLLLAVSLDAPPSTSTMDDEGYPRPHSHLLSWGYSQLILHLIKLPADFITKEKMTDICRSCGFWPGYLILCLELERRREAFTNIVYLNDMSLMEGDNGWIPETVEEWKLLLHLIQSKSTRPAPQESLNGSLSDGPSPINVENVALLLAKAMGPDRAWSLLQECGLALELSEKFTRTCDILRIAEKRQRALIQSMLEKCDRFLWSQQA
ncbi:BLOC-2 complex member HPS5 isoform p [Homo sapiens]|uniref:BLOC-2 complex member HPS5 isoform p n=1 Tax=Homo sapiens TaxID=9606 RepID=UPI003D6B0407